ncbi:Cell wall-associated hydrolase, NlpC family [Alteribacillus persepolensis]|uniref:Cell wall-associated hydrolase, NlpC family n=1 Tax=Alteribacillus persepolensis TaxID=568899 RepID=A0A1G8H9M4_9BACI|nr:peptidoglycan-binding protein [Alteribacillus persepolensis]SDI03191.1 Cell wall-associated hydrolase, NlpC family [Alteribacillus persepolensis]
MFNTATSIKKAVVTSTAVTGAVLAAPLAADAALGDETLYPGTTSDDVKKLQHLLKDKGFFTYDKATGYYGEHTKAAVEQFQKKHHLTMDGIAGPQTFSVLLTGQSSVHTETAAPADTQPSEAKTSSVSLGSSTILRKGDESEEVKELQRQLRQLDYYNGEVTGFYGRQLQESVRRFQREEQLAADGIAGPETLAALQSVQRAAEPASYQTGASSDTFKVLSTGDKSSDVSLLQRQLKDLGYYNKDITGIFGPMTENAVRSFQAENGLVVDGLAGPKTLNKLKNNPKAASAAKSETVSDSVSAPQTEVLRYGSRGENVTALQSQLQQLGFMKMEPTGVYGEVTENAVKNFQAAHGLTQDGIAGEKTAQKLDALLQEEESETTTPPAPQEKPAAGTNVDVTNLVADAAEHIGVPYVWGGDNPSGFDCSGFLQYVFAKNGIELPRTVAGMYHAGTSVNKPKVGDIVFYETYQEGPSHAGIYIGSNQFIHAGTSTGVTVSNMNTAYWEERFVGVKRYF